MIHRVEWEAKRRKDEIIELEQAQSEANIALNNERKKAIFYSTEIEKCKTRVKEDKRRIEQLLKLAEPIEQTIKLYQGRKPEITEKYSNYNFEKDNVSINDNSVSLKKALNKTGLKNKEKPQTNYKSGNQTKTLRTKQNGSK